MKRIRMIICGVLIFALLLSTVALASGKIKTTGDTNLRKGAGLKYKIIKVVPKGTTLTYTSTKTDSRDVKWYKVTYKSKTGWISSIYTKKASDDETPLNTVWAKKGSTNIRKSPSLSGKILGVLKKGDYATYLRQTKKDSRGITWYKITTRDGKITGWVSSKYTKRHN